MDTIKNHKDLTLIAQSIKDGKYEKMSNLLSDVKRMFTNCEVYWPRASPEYRAGKELSKYFNQLVSEVSSDRVSNGTKVTNGNVVVNGRESRTRTSR